MFTIIKNAILLLKAKFIRWRAMKAIKAKLMLCSCRGENFVDSGIKILIAVVIGALLLGGLYALFGAAGRCGEQARALQGRSAYKACSTIRIMPTVTQRVQEMFNFAG